MSQVISGIIVIAILLFVVFVLSKFYFKSNNCGVVFNLSLVVAICFLILFIISGTSIMIQEYDKTVLEKYVSKIESRQVK